MGLFSSFYGTRPIYENQSENRHFNLGRFDELRQGGGVEWKNPSENQHFGLGRFDELRQRGGVEWKNPSENPKMRGANGDQQNCVGRGGGPTGKGLLLIGTVIPTTTTTTVVGS